MMLQLGELVDSMSPGHTYLLLTYHVHYTHQLFKIFGAEDMINVHLDLSMQVILCSQGQALKLVIKCVFPTESTHSLGHGIVAYGLIHMTDTMSLQYC